MPDDDQLRFQERPLYDSGYTDEELDGIFRSLVNGDDVDWLESYVSALVIGLCDGEIERLADGGTVRLRTPRAELDRRVAMVRAEMAAGATFHEAFCTLPSRVL
jgi:hypothetical protein